MEPLVTIGITTFNSSETISRALESAKEQKWRNIEIVIVDDCSKDDTYQLVKKYINGLVPLRVFRNKSNSGIGFTRNVIIEHSQGEFLAFFDDDDVSAPNRLEEQYKAIKEYENRVGVDEMIICYTARTLIFSEKDHYYARTIGVDSNGAAPCGISVAENILLGYPLSCQSGGMPTCSQMARLSTYKKLCGFDSQFRRSEDTEFNIRAAKAGAHFVGVQKPLVKQYMTKTEDKCLGDEEKYTLMLLDKHRDVADNYGIYRFCKEWIKVKYFWLKKDYVNFVIFLSSLLLLHPKLSFNRISASFSNYLLNRKFSYFHNN